MENLIIYGLLAIGVIASIIRNYQKEAEKNKKRTLNVPRTKPTSPYLQESDQTRPVSAPFSRPQKPDSERSYNETSYETVATQTVSDVQNKYQTLTSMGYDYTQEGTSSITHEYDEKKDEKRAFTHDVNDRNAAQDLQLETPEDLQKAFIHSIILERKY